MEIVQKKECNQCLFSENKIVSDERFTQILKECKEGNLNFLCHKATIAGREVICHQFYKRMKNPEISAMFERLGIVKFVDVT